MQPPGNTWCGHGRCSGSCAVHAVWHCRPRCVGWTSPGLAHHVHRKPARRATGSPPAAAARGADAGMVALTRATGIVIGVMASLLLSCIIFPKSASMSARAAAQKARS